MSRRLVESVTDSAIEAGEAALDAGVTIAARLPLLTEHLVMPSAEGFAEWSTAIGEKISAAWDGTLGAASVWHAMVVNACWSVPTPLGLAHDTVAMMRAGARPAQIRVRANATRFTAREP